MYVCVSCKTLMLSQSSEVSEVLSAPVDGYVMPWIPMVFSMDEQLCSLFISMITYDIYLFYVTYMGHFYRAYEMSIQFQ